MLINAGPLAPCSVLSHAVRLVTVLLNPKEAAIVQFAPNRGFPFKNIQDQVSYIWRLAITTDTGFVPSPSPASDTRFLGVRVLPLIIR